MVQLALVSIVCCFVLNVMQEVAKNCHSWLLSGDAIVRFVNEDFESRRFLTRQAEHRKVDTLTVCKTSSFTSVHRLLISVCLRTSKITVRKGRFAQRALIERNKTVYIDSTLFYHIAKLSRISFFDTAL
ncbi:hypothetical protein SISSUDRAFT_817282 [Sistotremastrum suecicum HHB10207 ss-3]|uniref:Secreted protein n=1 Tax=Sistotremastrum suecicum HHB10207 ss-3 TaxID=1314776 RepID=A0A166CV06_9AGAM|nr:hypothetical protein SISSUDRAFT_817282 [Sistotremastrum suecicum HHB10207 ss-3]